MSTPEKTKILLVEDSPLMQKMEISVISSLGYKNIVSAENGNDAIEKLQEQGDIDLIISDWNMPEKDGYELLLWVRADEKCKNIPFLMATGQGDREQAEKASGAGVSSFIAKPFNAEELQKKIDEALGLIEEEEEIPEEELSPQIGASGKVVLRIAHIQITDHLLLGMMQNMIQRGELQPKYFELETRCMPGWNPVQQDLEKGRIDAAFVLAPIAMDLFAYGAPIKLVMFAHKNGSIFVRGKHGLYEDPYENFFRGKTFYIPHKMSVHHMLAHMFFKQIGLDAGMEGHHDITFEVVPPIKMPEFLATNPAACGYMVAEPLGTKAIAAGAADLQFLSGELWENHPCCILAMRDSFIEQHRDAVYEFTEMLAQAGSVISQKPDSAAEVAVNFLDPNKALGLKVPLLKNVLREAQGIKTSDLYPVIEDLDRMQRYMSEQMGFGKLIDLEKFVTTEFAQAACKESITERKASKLRDSATEILGILHKGVEDKAKSLLNKEGKYITFTLCEQEYGIDILKIKEIVGMREIRTVPKTPDYYKGVIDLRGNVIPIIDLRLKFDMDQQEYHERTCIIILQLDVGETIKQVGVVVDAVSEVMDITASDIEETPSFGFGIDTSHLLAMAKVNGSVKMLLDIDKIISTQDVVAPLVQAAS